MTDSHVITQEVWLRHWCECNAHPSLSRFYSRNARARLDKCVYRASNSVHTRGSRGDEKKTTAREEWGRRGQKIRRTHRGARNVCVTPVPCETHPAEKYKNINRLSRIYAPAHPRSTPSLKH